jgi:dienelactone hydrolase
MPVKAHACRRVALATALGLVSLGARPAPPMLPLAERVSFPSADGATTLTGYLFRPERPTAAQVPAVVMMHGRGGVYSSLANGDYSAATISRRHQEWGHLWARQGYIALLVDGFGPRGYPSGFPRFSYDSRPKELDEVAVRPLDAYGALIFLRDRTDVARTRIVLQGWSNGGSATLAAMAAKEAPGVGQLTSDSGFRAAVAFYPACGLKGQFPDGLVPYAPVRIFHGTADEEVSPGRCEALVNASQSRKADIEIVLYPDAEHGFDDPGRKRQDKAANVAAKADATAKTLAFVADAMRRQGDP